MTTHDRTVRPDLTIARISAAAAVIAGMFGAVGGGLATYLGNKALENSANRANARGIARVYQGEFQHIDTRLRAMLATNRLIPPDDTSFQLSVDDMKTLAGAMSNDAWYFVRATEAGLSRFDRLDDERWHRAAAGQAVPLDRELRAYIRDNAKAAEGAIRALSEVAAQ